MNDTRIGPSKFYQMKQKLQLKGDTNETRVHRQEDLFEEKQPTAVPPLQNDSSAVQNDLVENEVVEDDVVPDNQDNLTENVPAKKKNRSSLFNRSSPMKLVRLCKGMTPEQQDLITKSDLGDIILMKCSKLIPELCRFLLASFDPVRCVLDFGDRGRIPVTVQSVAKVLGVPIGSSPVPYYVDAKSTTAILEMLGIHDGVQPTFTYLEKELGPKQPADDLYLRKFVIYLISSIFAPTTGIKVSPKCYPSVMNATSVSTLNWAKFIIDILIQTANAKGKKNWFKACMPYLMILYVDSLETNALDVPEDGTRCCVWSNSMISLVAGLDTNNDGSFGRLPLKPCFRTNLSLFTTEPIDVDMFIKRHLPDNHTDEDLAKYRPAVINMCKIFEDGLAKFINSSGKADDKGITNNQVEEEVHVLRNIQMDKPKRRRRTKVSEHAAAAQTTENSCHERGDLQRDDQVPQNQEASPNAIAEKTKKRKYVAGLGGQRAAKKLVPVSNVEPLHRSDQGDDHGDEGVRETMELPHVASNVSVIVDATANALNQLQFYGTPSQTRNETIEKDQPAQHTPSTVHVQSKDELQTGCTSSTDPGRTSSGKKRKSVTFDIEEKDMQINTNYTNKGGEHRPELKNTEATTSSPSGRRPVTRSMSPKKTPVNNQGDPRATYVASMRIAATTPIRLTRFSTAKARLEHSNANLPTKFPGTRDVLNRGESGDAENNMNRNLDQDFCSSGGVTETDVQKKQRELFEFHPSFDLGFDTQTSQEAEDIIQSKEPDTNLQEIVVISSNDSGDSLDKIYATIEIPTTTTAITEESTVNTNKVVAEEELGAPDGKDSCTPVPRAHQKRIVKPAQNQKSPFVDYANKEVVSKYANEVYSRVCMYGGESEDDLNKEKIIDCGGFYIELRDLADSVKPRAWISNSTVEIALRVLSSELENQKKHVMPLRIATKLRSVSCINDRMVKKAFKMTPACRLDHKEQIMFGVLQDLTPDIKQFNGHYYLIVLNLKAEVRGDGFSQI